MILERGMRLHRPNTTTAPKSTPLIEHETLALVTDLQRKSTTAASETTVIAMSDTRPKSTPMIARETLVRMTDNRLFRALIPFLPSLVNAALVRAGLDYDHATTFVTIGRPVTYENAVRRMRRLSKKVRRELRDSEMQVTP